MAGVLFLNDIFYDGLEMKNSREEIDFFRVVYFSLSAKPVQIRRAQDRNGKLLGYAVVKCGFTGEVLFK